MTAQLIHEKFGKFRKYFFTALFLLLSAQVLASSDSASVSVQKPPASKKFTYPNQPMHPVAVSDKHKFVWFRVAKVGSSTIRSIIKNNQVELSTYSHIKFNPDDYKDYFKFAIVRNPWSRVVSAYIQKVVQRGPNWKEYYSECYDKDFDYFVDFLAKKDLVVADKHIRLQTALIPVEHLDFIGRLENFDEDMRYVLSVIGIDQDQMPHCNKTKHAHYSTYYNERTKAIIAKIYKNDIEAFGYEFKTP